MWGSIECWFKAADMTPGPPVRYQKQQTKEQQQQWGTTIRYGQSPKHLVNWALVFWKQTNWLQVSAAVAPRSIKSRKRQMKKTYHWEPGTQDVGGGGDGINNSKQQTSNTKWGGLCCCCCCCCCLLQLATLAPAAAASAATATTWSSKRQKWS